jgi:hypothetical protein
MQLKMGGKFHLKLNIGERPIANKYREGKMKSTLEREAFEVSRIWRDSAELLLGVLLVRWVSINFDRGRKAWGMWLSSGSVIAPCCMPRLGLRNAARLMARGSPFDTCLGCWHNGFKRPVLKHGPRSLTCAQVFGC